MVAKFITKIDKAEQDEAQINRIEATELGQRNMEELFQKVNKNIKMAIRQEVKRQQLNAPGEVADLT